LQTFDISHAFLPLTIAKLSMFKNGPVFWPTLYNACDFSNCLTGLITLNFQSFTYVQYLDHHAATSIINWFRYTAYCAI